MDESGAELVEAYLAGELDAEGVARLEAWLRADPANRAAFARAARRRVHLRDEIGAHLERTSAGLSGRRGRSSPRGRRVAGPTLWIGLAAAALILVTIAAMSWPSGTAPSTQPPAVIAVDCAGSAGLERAGAAGPLSDGTALRGGDRITGPCTLRFADGSRVVAAAAASLEVALDGAVRLVLDHGRIEADIVPQPAGSVFAIRTPQAMVTVIGTRFAIDCADGQCRVSVSAGRVRVAAPAGERMVAAGEQVVAGAHGLAARILTVAAADTPAALRPANALASLQAAVDAARPGDLVRLLPGHHAASNADPTAHLRIRARGTATAPIVIAGDPAGGSVIASRAWNGLQIEDAAHLDIRDLVVEGAPDIPDDVLGNGIRLLRSHHITVAGCTVRNLRGDGIAAQGCDHLRLSGNRIEACSLRSRWGQAGITVMTSVAVDDAPGPHIVIVGNRISHGRDTLPNESGDGSFSGGNGIQIVRHRAGDGAEDQPGYPGYAEAMVVRGNTCWANAGAGLSIYRSDRVEVAHNTFHRNTREPGRRGEIVLFQAGGIVCEENLVAPQPDLPAMRAMEVTGLRASGNLVWGGDPAGWRALAASPWPAIADEDARTDFRLVADSPARGVGADGL
jgi:ferric-dicitrate binding protein FerR (iron transport regulator)